MYLKHILTKFEKQIKQERSSPFYAYSNLIIVKKIIQQNVY